MKMINNEDDFEMYKTKSWQLFDNSPVILTLRFVLAFCMAFGIFFVPIGLVFPDYFDISSAYWTGVYFTIDFLWFVEMFLNFITIPDGFGTFDPKKVAWSYFRHRFFLDLIVTAIPILTKY